MTVPTRTSGRWELLRALAALAERPTDPVAEALSLPTPLDRADHTEVFTFTALPYASAYLGDDGMLGGEAATRVAGFWAALGYPPPDPPDHLAALLGLYAALGEREMKSGGARRVLLRQGRHALLWEHLLPWTGVFCDLVRQVGIPPWSRWADLLEQTLEEARDDMTEAAPTLPRQLDEAPAPLDRSFEMPDLLAPLRTGMMLTRSDLARGARHLGLGVRLTGRLPTLRVLVGQSPRDTLGWVADHARRWERLHRRRSGPEAVGRFWAGRAANTGAVLDAILAEA